MDEIEETYNSNDPFLYPDIVQCIPYMVVCSNWTQRLLVLNQLGMVLSPKEKCLSTPFPIFVQTLARQVNNE